MKFQDKLNSLNVEMALDAIKESHGAELDAQVDRMMGIVAKQKQKVDARKPTRVAPSGYMGRAAAFKYARYKRYMGYVPDMEQQIEDLQRQLKKSLGVVTLVDLREMKRAKKSKAGSAAKAEHKAAAKGARKLNRRGPKGGPKV
jgi:hypothetical protein